MNRPLITFTSDFGLQDWFVGVVHGTIHTICPDALITDLAHQVSPGNIRRAAFIIEAAAPDFPEGTLHLAVVDPGVGTERRALAVRAHGQLFIGPDNGLLEHAFADPHAEVRHLTETKLFRHPVSRTFHGRDVFAPVTAHLACGEPFEQVGPVVDDPVRLPHAVTNPMDGGVEGQVMFVDRFGNALTNVREADLAAAFRGVDESDLQITVVARTIEGVARSYGDHEVGTLVALMGSSGRLEIAMVGGDVALRFGIGEGDPVTIRPR